MGCGRAKGPPASRGVSGIATRRARTETHMREGQENRRALGAYGGALEAAARRPRPAADKRRQHAHTPGLPQHAWPLTRSPERTQVSNA